MQNCQLKTVQLPTKEKAQNLVLGRWQITRATDDYLLAERPANSSGLMDAKHLDGCKSCIVTIACGHEIEGDNVLIKSDLASCSNIKPVKLDISLPSALTKLFGKLPPLPDLPNMVDLKTAQSHLFQKFQLELTKLPTDLRTNQHLLDKIADPIVFEMQELNPISTINFLLSLT